MTFLDAARVILEQAKQPLHYEEIARRAIDQKLISSDGDTPEATMGSRLYTVTKEEGSGFVRVQRGIFDLAKRSATGIDAQVEAIYQATRQRLRELLAKVPPKRFETLIMELLVKMGFDESTAEVTPYSGDGGIDVRGQYQAGGLAWINAAVQVKRWKSNVQAPQVTALRGSLQVHQQGILITTSDFSSGARAEATAPGKTRIGLVSGEQLIDLLIRHHVGVVDKPLTVTLVDEEWWGEVLELVLLPTPQMAGASVAAEDNDFTMGPPEPKILEPNQANPAWTGNKPTSFVLFGEMHNAKSWKQMLVTVTSLLAARHQDTFVATVAKFDGKKRAFVGNNPASMTAPAAVEGTGLWMETNWSAESIRHLISNMLDAFGYTKSDIEITLATQPAEGTHETPATRV